MPDVKSRRATPLAYATIVCLVAAAVVAVFAKKHRDRVARPSTSFGDIVQLPTNGSLASPAAPVRLSEMPNLVMSGGTLKTAHEPTTGRAKPVQRLVLENAEFVLDANAAASEPWSTMEKRPTSAAELVSPLFQQLQSFGFDSLQIQNSTLFVQWGKQREKLSALNAEIRGGRRTVAGRHEPLVAKGTFVFRGQTLTFDAALAPPGSSNRRAETPLSFNLSSDLIAAQFDGKIGLDRALSLVGPLEATTSRPIEFARWLGLQALPANVAQNVQLKADVEWRGATLALHTLSGKLDNQPMTGRLALNHSSERAKIDGSVAFQSIDLTPYVATMLRDPADIADLESHWPSVATTATLARTIDIDIRLSASKPTLRSVTLKPLALTVISSAGKLQADLPAIEVGSSRGSIQISVDTTAEPLPKTSIRSRFETGEISQFVQALTRHDVLGGRAQVMVDLTGTGSTLDAVLRSAHGRFQIANLNPLRLSGDLRGLRVEALKASSPLPQAPDSKPKPPELGWGLAQRRPTTLDRVELRGTMHVGTMTIETGRIEANNQVHALTGQVGFTTHTLSLLLAQLPKPTSDDRPANTVGSLRPSADRGNEGDPISISGPWLNPTIRLDRSQPRY